MMLKFSYPRDKHAYIIDFSIDMPPTLRGAIAMWFSTIDIALNPTGCSTSS